MISELFSKLKELNISIQVVNGGLDIKAPAGVMTEEILETIRTHKEELICFINDYKQQQQHFEAIPLAPLEASYPLSSSQRRLWLLSQQPGGNVAYNIPGVYVFEGALNLGLLKGAFEGLLSRHEILRTVFVETDTGEVRQVVNEVSALGFRIGYKDLRRAEAPEQRLADLLEQEHTRAFDLENGPLLRVSLFQLGEDRWVLSYVMHHIISDGWSMNILLEELLVFYKALEGGEEPVLAPLSIQYKDYASWQQEGLSSGGGQDRQYWQDIFADGVPVLDLVTDRPRPGVRSYKGAVERLELRTTTLRLLEQLVQSQGCTLFMGLLAAVNTLLYRYTQQEDIVIGTAVAGRDHADLEGQIGFYVNTLALRTRFQGESDFLALLAQVKEVTLGAYAHQGFPFDELVEALPLKYDKHRHPVFDVLVVLNQAAGPSAAQRLGEVTVRGYDHSDHVVSKFDLSFNFSTTTGGLHLQVEYDTDLYSAGSIRQLCRYFEELLGAIVSAPQTPLYQLSYLNATMKESLLSMAGDRTTGYPSSETILSLFASQVCSCADRIAVVYEDRSLSYMVLNEVSNQVGDYLRRVYGVQRGDLVGVKLERSEWQVIVLLGILKSGGAYVPIDPGYPQDRVSYMMEDSGCKLLLDEAQLELFRSSQGSCSKEDQPVESSPEDIAYVIYTSGTTGRPKGTLISHGNVVRLFRTDRPLFDFGSADVWTMFHSYSFDFSVWEMYGGLLNGGRVVVVPLDTSRDPSMFAKLLEREQVTVLNQTPSSFYSLMPETSGINLSLRYVIFGGEALHSWRLLDWHDQHRDVRLVNMYGITETTVHVTYKQLEREDLLENSRSIGVALPTLQCYVLDAYGQLTGEGIAGELYVGGAGVSPGYLNRRELTAARFIADPFSPGGRLYRSGDKVRLLPHGELEYLGRLDDQVKIRGYRIELGEVEHALVSCAGVSGAVVLSEAGQEGEQELVGYLACDAGLDVGAVKGRLASLLPWYMHPSRYVQLDRLPQTSHGKVDRAALRSYGLEQRGQQSCYQAPRTAIERRLSEIWGEILGMAAERISVDHNFFELGGHSLKAARLSARLHKEFNTRIGLKSLFEHATLEGQAQLLLEARQQTFLSILPADEQPHYPASASQRNVWLACQVPEANIAYNIPGTYMFENGLNRADLSVALQALISRHEILRTVFREDEEGAVRQYIQPDALPGFELDYHDLREVADQDVVRRALIEKAFTTPFDLAAGPLLRTALLQLSEERCEFVYVMHHIISDGWSMKVLMKELLHLYNARQQGGVEPLPPLRIQYKDYATWQQLQLNGALQPEQEAYWLNQFAGELPVLELPADKPRPPVKTYHGAVVGKAVEPLIAEGIAGLSQAQGATFFMGLLAAVKVLLYRYSLQEDIIIGSPMAGRDHADLEDQIGFYVNTLALRTQFKGDESYNQLLGHVKEVVLSAHEHQLYPFDQLVSALDLRRDMSRHPLFDVMVLLEDTTDLIEGGPSEMAETSRSCLFDLVFTFTRHAGGLYLNLTYNTDIYSSRTARQLLSHLEQLLSAITAHPELPVSELEMLSEAEQQLLLAAFNDTTVAYPAGDTVLSLFREQVLRMTDQEAVVQGTSCLVYQELDELSDRLANYLVRQHGIGSNDRVAIMMDRSPLLIVAILGVLKAGAAYVPVDTAYPAGRKAFMLEDTEAAALLTQAGYPAPDSFNGTVLTISEEQLQELEGGAMPKPIPPDADTLAYIIYTSGSTGRPKGVMIRHSAIVNTIRSQQTLFEAMPGDRHLQFAAVSFDASVSEIFVALCSGGTLYIVPEQVKRDPILLTDYINANAIGIATLPPAFLAETYMPALQSLKQLITAGEPAVASNVNDFLPYGNYINAYGPTEAAVCATVYKLPQGSMVNTSYVPIGRPIANTAVYILDPQGRLLPPGVTGEIYVSGPGLALGYLHQPEQTAEKFVDNPFRPGTRMYRTGDLGRWDSTGNIVFAGRRDEQVKVRGYRVELKEIEHCLLTYPGISAAVVTVDGEHTEKTLVAYIVMDNAPDITSLRAHLALALPAYMLPGHFVRLDELPLTGSGKVDKQALPGLRDTATLSGSAYVAPQTDEERHLAAIYGEVLKKPIVSVTDDFFMLGGDSIKSIQVVSRLKQRGYSLTIQDVLLHPVISDLARQVKTQSRVIPQDQVVGLIPLSPVQARFFERHPANNHHYNQSVLLYSKVPLNAATLRIALERLMLHHDTLRIVFHPGLEGWLQENRNRELKYHFEEISITDSSQFNNHCERIQAGFNLEKGPLFKMALLHAVDGDYLLLAAHHLIVDGVSWRILMEDLSNLYQQHETGVALDLPLKTDSFKYWMARQQVYSNSPALLEEDTYWSAIAAQPLPSLPVDFEGGSNLVKDLRTASFSLDTEQTFRLQNACYQAYRTEMNDILLTGLGLALETVFGLNKALIALEGHGRENIGTDIDVSRTIGWFTTVYPVLLDLQHHEDIIRQLVAVKEVLHRVPNKGIGYGILRYLSGKDYNLQPQLSFNYLGDFGSSAGTSPSSAVFEYSGAYRGQEQSPEMEREVMLEVSGMIVGGELRMTIGFSGQQYAQESMDKLAQSYRQSLEALIQHLSAITEAQPTPVDLSYKELSLEQVAQLHTAYGLEDVYPLSPLQEGLYFHWLVDPGSPAYFIQTICRIQGSLHLPVLEESYRRLVQRHAILRTFFSKDLSDCVLQVVQREVPPDFRYVDLSTAEEAAVMAYRKQDRDTGFDLHKGSQIRLSVLRLAEDRYEFIWSHHHILMDGWCGSILIREFFDIYYSLLEGRDTTLQPINSYSDYIAWLGSVNKAASLDYWRSYVAGYNTVSTLQKAPLKSGEDTRLLRKIVHLPSAHVQDINRLCGEMGITANTFIQTAWGILLGKYNNCDDVVFGAVVSGRPAALKGVEEMIGLFSNTIPVRINTNGVNSVRELLKKAQQDAISAADHHYIQLAEVQAESELGRNLFDHILAFENFPVQEVVAESVEAVSLLSLLNTEVIERTNYDFTLTVTPGEIYEIRMDYKEGLFEEAQLDRLFGHFFAIITSMLDDPSGDIISLDYLGKDEKDHLLSAAASPVATYPEDKTLVRLFEEQAAVTPDHIAVTAGQQQLSYRELNERANGLALYLREACGVKPNDTVGIKLGRSEVMIIAILGVLKSGAAYVPVDPAYPEERNNYMLTDSQCITVVDEAVMSRVNGATATGNLPPVNAPDDAAYVIYTSGTTGHPKGTVITHRNVVSLLKPGQPLFDFSAADVWTMFHSNCFDFSVWEMYGALLYGGRLVMVPVMVTKDPPAFLQLLRDEQVTVLNQTPSAFYALANEDQQRPPSALKLRYVIFGGEALRPSRLAGWSERYPDVKLVNMYGITETTVHVTCKELQCADIAADSSSIGKAIPSLYCYVLDQYRQLLPVGIPGELYVGGEGVARGYLHHAELNAQRFVDDPFRPGERLYRTGDKVKLLPDGEMIYLGRLDDQVKIRGYRIELGEVTTALLKHPEIKAAVIVPYVNKFGDNELIAYFTGNMALSFSDISSHMSRHIPEYMHPAHYVPLENIPLTGNGKIDRKALPAPEGAGLQAGRQYQAPENVTQQKLVEIWSDVLGIEQGLISVTDNFFDLGGHSLKAIQLQSRINATFQLQMNIQTVFRETTIENLASRIAFICDQNGMKENGEKLRQISLQ